MRPKSEITKFIESLPSTMNTTQMHEAAAAQGFTLDISRISTIRRKAGLEFAVNPRNPHAEADPPAPLAKVSPRIPPAQMALVPVKEKKGETNAMLEIAKIRAEKARIQELQASHLLAGKHDEEDVKQTVFRLCIRVGTFQVRKYIDEFEHM